MSPDNKNHTHLFFSALPSWGHVRSFCILAARLAKEHDNLVLTLLLSPNHLGKAEAEISSEFASSEVSDETRKRVRVLSAFRSESENPMELIPLLIQTYSIAYQTLSDAKPITCAMTGRVFDTVSAPKAVILDYFAHPQMLATRAITGHTVPIVAFLAAHAATILRTYGPEHLGGSGDLGAKIEAEAARRGVTSKEIGDSIYAHTEGKIISIPGIPDMYDWEYFPQELPFKFTVSDVVKMAYGGLKECDAIFSLSAKDFEPVSIGALKSWFGEWNKEVYTIGPLLPSKPTTYGILSDLSRSSGEIQEFLDNALKEYGQKSAVLISFGSAFWPTVHEYLDEVIEALVKMKFPFILSYASPFAKISDELLQKVKASNVGLISKWVPQQYILNHPATGWFITHAGQNGVLESLGSGIPMICWPFEADQPAAAAHLTENLKVAFELIEVRTGENGLKPLLRNGHQAKGSREAVGVEIRDVLNACRSDRGEKLRKNAEAMKEKFRKTWEADGVSRSEFQGFLEKYGIRF